MSAPFPLAIIRDSLSVWAFPLGCVAFWCVISFLISRFGWSAAAKQFPAKSKPEGKTFRASSILFPNGSHYGACVKVIPTPEGLYLAVEFLFALGCRPMLVPWEALATISEHKGWFGGRYLKIETAGVDGFTIRLPMSALPQVQPFADAAHIPCHPLPCI